VLDVYK